MTKTTPAEENRIEAICNTQIKKGFNGAAPIVYRDLTRVGLGLAVIANNIFAGQIDIQLSPRLNWCVITTQNAADNKRIREKVAALRQNL